MKRNILFILLIICLLPGIYGQAEKEKIVVLNFKGIKVDKDMAEIVTENFITAIVDLKVYEVIERAQLNKILEELKLTKADDFTENTALEIGKLAKSKVVIIGSVGKIGDQISINARGIEVETGKIIIGKNVTAANENEILKVVKQLAALISNKEADTTVKDKAVIEDKTKSDNDKAITEDKTKTDKVVVVKKTDSMDNLKMKKAALACVISGSILLGIGLPSGLLCLIFVTPNEFAKTRWTTFYNNRISGVYIASEVETVKEDMIRAYNVTVFFAALGLTMAAAGFALDMVSIPLFIKSKSKVAVNFNLGFNEANPALCMNIKF